MAPQNSGNSSNLNYNADVGILLATYCEAPNIERLITEIENMHMDSQILVIDDSSPDGTADIVRNLQTKFPNILLTVRPAKLGLGTAITCGFKTFLLLKNPPKQIIVMDADYSHNPKDIPALLSSLEKGDGLVIGSRYCPGGRISGWPLARRVISRVANVLAKTIARLQLNDCTSGFRCYSTQFLKAAIGHLHCTTYEIQIETAKQARTLGFGIREVPVLFINRKRGKSKLSSSEITGYFSYIFKTLRTT